MHLLLFAESIQLFPDGTIFLHIAILLGMIWILNRTLYRPINRVLETREKNKGGLGGEAAEILGSVEEKEARYARELLETRSRAYETIENEQRQAAASREEKLAQAKAEASQKFEAEKGELTAQAAAARSEVGANAEQMADQIASSILKS